MLFHTESCFDSWVGNKDVHAIHAFKTESERADRTDPIFVFGDKLQGQGVPSSPEPIWDVSS